MQQAHRGGSAGRWCAAPGSRSAAPPHPCTLCPGCRSCRHRSRPAPRGDPVSGASLSPGTSTPPARPTQPPANPSCLPPPATTFRACSRARQASWRKVKDLGGGTSWMAEAWFRRFTANSCRRKGRSAATRLPAGRAPPPRQSLSPATSRPARRCRCSPGPGGGRCTSHCSPGTASPGGRLCSPGKDTRTDACGRCSDRPGFTQFLPCNPSVPSHGVWRIAPATLLALLFLGSGHWMGSAPRTLPRVGGLQLCPGASRSWSGPDWLGSDPSPEPGPHHGRAVVVVLVAWLPGLEAAPAEPMVTSGAGHAVEDSSCQGGCLWMRVPGVPGVPGGWTHH